MNLLHFSSLATYTKFHMLTFVHAGLVEIFSKSKWSQLVWRTFLLDTNPQLFIEIITDSSECSHASFVVRNNCGFEKTTASEFVKVITGLHIRIHVFYYFRGCDTNMLSRLIRYFRNTFLSLQVKRFIKLIYFTYKTVKIYILVKYL